VRGIPRPFRYTIPRLLTALKINLRNTGGSSSSSSSVNPSRDDSHGGMRISGGGALDNALVTPVAHPILL